MSYAFGQFRVEPRLREIFRDDERVPVEPRVFDVLLFLIRNRDRLVPREELLASCWSGLNVSDGTLSRCLSRIRQALDQPRDADAPIATLHGKGYRFAAPIVSDEPEDAPAPVEVPAGPARPAAPERRLLSVVDLRFARPVEPEPPETLFWRMRRLRTVAGALVAARDARLVEHCETGLRAHVGEVGATEAPAAAAAALAQDLLSLARREDLHAQVFLSTGEAIVDFPDTGGPPLIIMAEPLLDAGALRGLAGATIVADARSARLLEGTAAVSPLEQAEDPPLFAVGAPEGAGETVHGDEPRFIGRDRELIRLEDGWRRACKGEGRMAVVRGPAGIGKTRLVREMLARAGVPAAAVLVAQCSPYHRDSPFRPLLEVLRAHLGVGPDDDPLDQMAALETWLERIGRPESDLVPVLASLLSSRSPAVALPELRLAADRQRARTMDALLELLRILAAAQPVVIWVEDAQWADDSTVDTLAALAREIGGLPALLVACTRDAAPAVPTEAFAAAAELTLEPLSTRQCERVLSDARERAPIPEALLKTIAERSEGVPLYLAEYLRLATTQAPGVAEASVPLGIRSLVAARLDQTPWAKQTAQWLAVIGRAAPLALLREAADLEPDRLAASVAALVSASVIAERDGTLRFVHDLVREVAYAQMLEETRRERHARVADALDGPFARLAETDPEFAARQCAGAGRIEAAVAHWRRAARAAAEKGGVVEAQALLQEALDLLPEGRRPALRRAVEAEMAQF